MKRLIPGILAIMLTSVTLIKGYATAYCLKGTMANGEYTHEGACASSADRLGKVIILYQRNPDDSLGDSIGIYEVCDTGGTDGINNGTVIDVWKPEYFVCQDFMDKLYSNGCQGKVYIQVVEPLEGEE